jgi:hypothetical protein
VRGPFAQSQQLPAGWVDGSKNPELIPDSAAYRLVFLSLSTPPASSQHSILKQNALVARIGLSVEDQAILKQVLIEFTAQYTEWQAAWQQPGAAYSQLTSQAEAIVEQAESALAAQLSPDGNTKLGAYVQNAKKRMAVKP